jgi:hypothetical protein
MQPLWKKTPSSIAWLLLILFIAGAYAPLLLKGGIIADDWGDIAQNLICNGFFECYRSWFPLFSNRPLAPLPITATTLLFGLNISWYLIFNTAIYLIAIFTTASALKSLLTPFAKIVFIALASAPIIAMPIVISPINQSTATFAFLFWALSLRLLQSYCLRKTFLSYGTSYILLLASLLTYEVMLPLLVLTAALPFALNSKNLTEKPFQYILQYIAPIILILGAVLLWQKILAGLIFSTVYSRLAFDPNNIGLFFLNWLSVFYAALPQLVIKSIKRIDLYGSTVSVVLALTLLFFWTRQASLNVDTHSARNSKLKTFLILLFCFFASSLIFILSGAYAEIGGNDARALSSAWICMALLIASTINFFSKKILALVFAIFFCCLAYISFGVQRDNYIRSWQLQKTILKDVLEKIESEGVTHDATIIGNVPGYLPDNFNNEIVFTQPWDFGAALSLYTNKKIAGGAVLDTRASNFSKPLQLSDGVLAIDRWWKTNTQNLWFYDYDPKTKSSSLVKIPNIDALKKLLVSLGYLGEFEKASYVTTNSPIQFSIDWLDRSKYIASGWGERESWGGIWSTQNRATIKLPMPESGAKSISFIANAFVNTIHPKQDVLVFINGQKQGKVLLNKFEGNEFSIPLPQLADTNLPITIEFEFPDAASPKSLNLGDDDRKLGIGLKSATFH